MAKALSVGAMNAVNTFNVNYMMTGSVVASGAATVLQPVMSYCRAYVGQHCAARQSADRRSEA